MEPLKKKIETDKIHLFYYIIMILISIDAKILIKKNRRLGKIEIKT